MIMIPITRPATNALSEDMDQPWASPMSRRKGATVSTAKNPYTTVGTPARISSAGFAMPRNRSDA